MAKQGPPLEDYGVVRDRRAAAAEKDREAADRLWRQLQASGPPREWKGRVLEDPALQGWALCERFCDESAELAESDPGAAEELAAMAVTLAPKVAGEETLVCGIQEYAWTHLGNACRAKGDLAGADEAFRRAQSFFTGAMAGIWPSLLRRQRLAPLKARLQNEQGKLGEAMETIEFALQLATSGAAMDGGEGHAVLLLEKCRLRRRFGQTAEAVKDLTRAAELAAKIDKPRLALRIAVERIAALCDAGRHAEVKKLSPALLKVAEGLAPERSRLLCLDGRVAAGLGRVAEAEAVLERDPAEFHPRAIPELALLLLELAALQAREGRTAELKRLAESMPRLAERLGREAAASLKFFSRLAAQDKMSGERATQFATEFVRFASGH